MKCKICGQDNPPEARFCANCGTTLVSTVEPPSQAAMPSPPAATTETAVEYIGFWNKYRWLVVAVVAIAIVSGLIVWQISTQPSPAPTRKLVYEDDFSNPNSGWLRKSVEAYECDYEDGEYYILVKEFDSA